MACSSSVTTGAACARPPKRTRVRSTRCSNSPSAYCGIGSSAVSNLHW